MIRSCKILMLVICTALFVVQCSPAIGDSCRTSNDCPTAAFCDITVPNGYCTIGQCDAGECPDNSTCITFDSETSYCMKTCDSNDDCREEHICRDSVKGQTTTSFCYIEED